MNTLLGIGNSIHSGLNWASNGLSNHLVEIAHWAIDYEPKLNAFAKIPGTNIQASVEYFFIATYQTLAGMMSFPLTGLAGALDYCFEAGVNSSRHLLQMEIALRMGTNGLLNYGRSLFSLISPLTLAEWDWMAKAQLINYLPKGQIPVF